MHVALNEMDAKRAERALGLAPLRPTDVTWTSDDREGPVTLAGMTGYARLFVDGEACRLVWWPNSRPGKKALEAAEKELEELVGEKSCAES